jgi:hypothetical protein
MPNSGQYNAILLGAHKALLLKYESPHADPAYYFAPRSGISHELYTAIANPDV